MFGYPVQPILIYSTSFTTVTEDRHIKTYIIPTNQSESTSNNGNTIVLEKGNLNDKVT